jgi:hypothetical protein
MSKKRDDPLEGERLELLQAPLTQKVGFFFDAPENFASPFGLKSTLQQLRRELQMTLYDVDEIMPEDVARWRQFQPRRLFASIGLMMTTIDLLAKMHAGRDDGRIGDRFQRFCRAFLPGISTSAQSAVLWSYRNSLSHSFGLYDRKRVLSIRQINTLYRPLQNRRGTNRWALRLVDLQISLMIATGGYRRRILSDPRTAQRFSGEMFSRYAILPISGHPPSTTLLDRAVLSGMIQ